MLFLLLLFLIGHGEGATAVTFILARYFDNGPLEPGYSRLCGIVNPRQRGVNTSTKAGFTLRSFDQCLEDS